MASYLVRRLLMAMPVLLGVTLLTFAIIQITPGDPVRLMLGRNASEEQVATVRQQMGLDDPLFVQFFRYVGRVIQGDLGLSIRGQRPVLEEILLRFPSTLQLTLAALTFAAVVGITLGVLAATTRHKWLDGTAMVAALVGLSIPDFWLSILFILFLACSWAGCRSRAEQG
jgi:peptide/nickel transport system permease protein